MQHVPTGQIRQRLLYVSILTRPEGRVQRADRGALAPRSMKVSILTRPEGRVQPVYPQHAQRWVLLGFNPHPARRPGATIDGYANIALRIMVSILTRPEGRVQHCAGAASSMERGFQSSPGQKAGCNRPALDAEGPQLWFQSSPGQKAGCNLVVRPEVVMGLRVVSILTRPEGRVQRLAHCERWVPRVPVSILTRPEGRVQLRRDVGIDRSLWFQSSPGQKAGCNKVVGRPSAGGLLVSILTRPEGRVQLQGVVALLPVLAVSILTRPEGRVQPLTPSTATLTACFNPHPARRPGATVLLGESVQLIDLFQPGLLAGCNTRHQPRLVSASRVSILTRPEGRVQHASAHANAGQLLFQSSPGQKAGCNHGGA